MKTAEGKSSTAAAPVSTPAISSRLETKRAARDAQIAELYLRGCSQPEIARRLGMLSAKVKESIARSVIEWKALAIFNIGEAKAVELQRINRMEREAWRSFELSRRGRPILDLVTRKPQQPPRFEEVPGDKGWLMLVKDLIKSRCEILGLNAAEKVEATITTTEKFISREEMGRRIAAKLAGMPGSRFRQVMEGVEVGGAGEADDGGDGESSNGDGSNGDDYQNHNGNGHTQN